MSTVGIRALATALELGGELEGIVTYDERLVETAQANGIAAISPRQPRPLVEAARS